jgi:hypothetical protein
MQPPRPIFLPVQSAHPSPTPEKTSDRTMSATDPAKSTGTGISTGTRGTRSASPGKEKPQIRDYIELRWRGDRTLYRGTVIGFDRASGRHNVVFDDGYAGAYDLVAETWRLLRREPEPETAPAIASVAAAAAAPPPPPPARSGSGKKVPVAAASAGVSNRAGTDGDPIHAAQCGDKDKVDDAMNDTELALDAPLDVGMPALPLPARPLTCIPNHFASSSSQKKTAPGTRKPARAPSPPPLILPPPPSSPPHPLLLPSLMPPLAHSPAQPVSVAVLDSAMTAAAEKGAAGRNIKNKGFASKSNPSTLKNRISAVDKASNMDPEQDSGGFAGEHHHAARSTVNVAREANRKDKKKTNQNSRYKKPAENDTTDTDQDDDEGNDIGHENLPPLSTGEQWPGGVHPSTSEDTLHPRSDFVPYKHKNELRMHRSRTAGAGSTTSDGTGASLRKSLGSSAARMNDPDRRESPSTPSPSSAPSPLPLQNDAPSGLESGRTPQTTFTVSPDESNLPPEKRRRTHYHTHDDSTSPLPHPKGPYVPLDHVMTAVIQATIMIMDERLVPITNRLNRLGEQVSRASLDSMAHMICAQHADHSDRMDGLRSEIDTFRSEHQGVISETVACKEAEMKVYFEKSLERATNEITQRCQSALSSVIDAATTSAAAATTPHTSSVQDHLTKEQMEKVGNVSPSERPQLDLQQAASHLPDQGDGPRDHLHMHGMKPVAPQPPHNEAVPTQVEAVLHMDEKPKGFHVLDRTPVEVVAHPSVDFTASDNAFRRRVLELVARQVTVWLLETQHEFNENTYNLQFNSTRGQANAQGYQERWVQDVVSKCMPDVANKLSCYESYERAIRALSSSLGDDNVELDWFLNPPSPESLAVARRNYAAWEPPPSDEEYHVEMHLLSELSERFQDTLSSYSRTGRESELGVAVEVCRLVRSFNRYQGAEVRREFHGESSVGLQGNAGGNIFGEREGASQVDNERMRSSDTLGDAGGVPGVGARQ